MRYNRVLLKLSGEALGCNQQLPDHPAVDAERLTVIAEAIRTVIHSGVEIGLVLGGGNWFRGATAQTALGLERVTADQMGMLGTLMNALLMRDALVSTGVVVRILSAIPITHMVEPFEWKRANQYLSEGAVVLFAGGTGQPFVSTDSAASLRAIEIKADILLKATSVDGVYSADPLTHPDAVRYDHISYDKVISDQLKVMDLAAFVQCREQGLPIRVFNMNTPNGLMDILQGKAVGTLVSE